MKSLGSGGPQATHRRAARDPERAQTSSGGTSNCRARHRPRQPRGLHRPIRHWRCAPRGRGLWSGMDPQFLATATLPGSPALPSHALGPASAFGLAPRGRRGEPWRGELRLCHHGHHHNDQQHVLSSECCEPDTLHTGVSFLISSPYF
jgi:hypothetical protein